MTATIIERYQRHLQFEKGASENTINAYLRDLRQFSAYLEQQQGSLAQVQAIQVESYVKALQEGGKSPASVARFLAAAKGFYGFLIAVDVRRDNPASQVRLATAERKIPTVLTAQEMEALLAQPSTTHAKGQRDRSMLAILYATGMRVGELLSLDIGDIDLFNAVIHCTGSGHYRAIPLYQEAVQALSQYVGGARPALITDEGQQALFVNMNGQRMSRQGFWKLIKGYQESAGIQKALTPQTLRHCFAVHLLENGAETGAVQQLLGHANVSTTKAYDRVVNQRLKEVYQKAHPKADKPSLD